MIWRYALVIPWIVFALVWLAAAPFTKKTVRKETLSTRAQFLSAIVIGIFILVARWIGSDAPWLWVRIVPASSVTKAIALGLECAGIAFAIWARATLGSLWSGTITLKENHRLVQSGPFAITRHPIYSGLVLAALGITIYVGSLHALFAFAIFVGAFVWKLSREEALMRATFGDEHRAYAERVRKLVPYVW